MYDGPRGQWRGGRTYGDRALALPELGSAGGAPPPTHHEIVSLAGGDGGGAITLRARRVVIDGQVTADGARGENGEYDAAGGGSGGGIVIEAERLWLRGRVSARGAGGGEGFELGGAGGGGRVRLRYAIGSVRRGVLDVAPGRGPCPGEVASPNGCAGSALVERAPAPAFLPLAAQRACLRAAPVTVVLVLDTSDSMGVSQAGGATGLEEGVAAALALLDGLLSRAPVPRVGLVTFRDAVHSRIVPDNDGRALRAALETIGTGPGSRLDAALVAAAELAGPYRPAALVVISDGALAADAVPFVRETSDALRRRGFALYGVGVGPAPGVAALEAAAPHGVQIHPIAGALEERAEGLVRLGFCPS
jgi:hypothetical protein